MEARKMIEAWKRRGRMVRVNGYRVFVVDAAPGTDNGARPVLAILHGYPSSSFDFVRAMPQLAEQYRVVIHDHLGFGLSEKPPAYSYSLLDQAAVALELWKQLGLQRIHLLAHDYGTSVATEILALRQRERIPVDIRSVTLSNGSIHIELARLRFIQKLLRHRFWGPLVARFSSGWIYRTQMRRLWSDRSKCDMDELQALWLMGSADGGRAVLPGITQYLRERYTYWDRWIGALIKLDIPCHILWAQDDPVAVAAIGEQLYREIPGAVITRLECLGHYPMLEDPARWAEAALMFLSGLPDAGGS
jgi:pimeloyl-ACP methyl ester carboxylesterase